MHPSLHSFCRLLTGTLAFLMGFASPGIFSASAQDHPVISQRNGDFTLKLPLEIVTALKSFNPGFVSWKTSDYTPTVVEEAVRSGDPRRAPFALVLDVNRDSVLDVVLDGHDAGNSLLVCAFSDHGAFKVVTVEQHEFVDPQTIENLDEGRKQSGLHYFLWPADEYGGDSTMPAFTVGHPQQSDSLGELLNDGAILSYFYENGAFRCETEIP